MRTQRTWTTSYAAFLCLALAFVLGDCATTHIEATWSNPDYVWRKVTGKVLIVGLTRDETVRRLYEDAMVAELHARGVEGVRSYDSISGQLAASDDAALMSAASKAGATRILSTAIVARQAVQVMETEPVPPPGWNWNYYGWYGYYWPYGYARTDTYEYERYFASTTLTEVASGKVYWSTRTRSDVSADVGKAVKDFALVIVDALAQGGLL